MCLNGRVFAAAALAVTVACGGSLPPPETRPVGTAGQTPHAVSVALSDREQRAIDLPLVAFATARRTVSR